MVNIEINGKTIQAREGSMLIEAADEAGITIPRFCYHKKLSVAANCRMCLVEVEKAPKPMPACATPVTEGMKVFTKSGKALDAQRAVMEFLLINHPLDCPICDQGGECELQEMAMGYGQDISRFSEKKRVVKDKNIGPLISTDMTRCIHCTRCVRFGQELAGIRELGATGRGEHMEIGTFIEKSVDSEISGNVIDLCPVGALTSKPFRYSARPWELTEHDSIAPHDCLGSNIVIETRRSRVMRVLPKENESINEVWLSDRDRFSYESVNSDQRLLSPMIKVKDRWEETDWNTALEHVAARMNETIGQAGSELGTLVSPSATLEELYLAQKLSRGLGSHNVDHRLRQEDFRDQDIAPVFPYLGQPISELETLDAALLIGSNIRKEQPLAALRLRKAVLNGARLMVVNPIDYDFNFPLSIKEIGSTSAMVHHLAGIAKSLLHLTGEQAPEGLDNLLVNVDSNDNHLAIAEHLKSSEKASVLLGNLCQASDRFADLRALAGLIAQLSGSRLGYLSEGANASGAWLSGAVPHRGCAGQTLAEGGLNAMEMMASPRKAYFLVGIEPELDMNQPAQATRALQQAELVVALSVFDSPALRDQADVLLPVTPFTETSGTYVNVAGQWQSFNGAVESPGEARPAWKVLRVLGNFFKLDGFDYLSSEQVRDEIRQQCEGIEADALSPWRCPDSVANDDGLSRIGETPMYAIDGLTRRATALQQTRDAVDAAVYMNPAQAASLGLQDGNQVTVRQGGEMAELPVCFDERIPERNVYIPTGLAATATLGAGFGPVELHKNI
ncbi:MAG: NADH-quinone oxidoreductase subunit G [Gammaproteobacteria bacterium]|nr:NADH-quinone oxidoreductase subunit G [Gammaproteobacteria bacterium]